MQKISGIITCFNEEENIADCIESLEWCDEIVIVDSFSTDRTKEIALRYEKVTFRERTYYGSASQKNWAMDNAKYDWLLILDADERCTESLKLEIFAILENPKYKAYTIRRKTYFLSKEIKYSGWQNDRVTRLVHKEGGRCPNIRAHGGIIPYNEAPLLKEPMLHYMVNDLKSYFDRLGKYGLWWASTKYNDGRKSSILIIILHTLWRFIKSYFVRLGVLDGSMGLVFCVAQSYGTFVKWAILWSWKNKNSGEIKLPEFDTENKRWYPN